ncbi:MAG: branched-chain amino acid ABC transporter substrate-binding protein [Anaerolineae bacterium]
MISRLLRSASYLFLVAAIITGCKGALTPSKGDIIVYVAAPLSGWQADGGQTVVGGAKVAAERANAAGGVLGYRIKVVALDDEADTDVAVNVANEIAGAVKGGERVLGIIGHYNSGQSAAALQIYKDLPVIVITPTSSDPSLTHEGYTNFFRVNATDASQAPYDADFMVNDLQAQRIAVVYAENDYGQALKDEMVKALQNLGKPAVAVIGIPEGADTQQDAVAKIQEANPDMVFLAGYETEGYVMLPELRSAGVTAKFMASDGCFLYEFIDGSGKSAEGAYVSGFAPDTSTVTDKAWFNSYQQLEARNPGTYSLAGYSAMTVLIEGARKANSLDYIKIGEALRSNAFSTLVGTIRYDANGDIQDQRIFIFQVVDGVFVQVKPAP